MSKLHEIREVYLEDINKKSKMIKSIGETLEEIQGGKRIEKEELLAWFRLIAEKAKEGFTMYDEEHFEQCYRQIVALIQELP